MSLTDDASAAHFGHAESSSVELPGLATADDAAWLLSSGLQLASTVKETKKHHRASLFKLTNILGETC